MAGKSPNLKVNVTADNSDLNRKMKESKESIRDFEKVSSSATDALAGMFGVNVDKIKQMESAIRGLGNKLQDAGNAGTVSFGKVLSSISGVSAAIGGLAIGATVAGFKALQEEAQNFKNTVAGANIEMATAAYIDTYRQVIHDFNSEVGKGAAEAESKWQKFWGTMGASLKAYISTGGLANIAGATDFDSVQDSKSMDRYYALVNQAAQAASTAEDISNRMYEAQRKLSDKSVEWARMERDIAEYKRIAYDKTVSTTEQQNALNEAIKLMNQRYTEEAEIRKTIADLQEEYNGLAESSVADIDKANQLRIQEENVVARLSNALRELSERQASITAAAKKEADERKAAADAAQKLVESRAALAAWGTSATSVKSIEAKAEQQEKPELAVEIKPELDTQSVVDITSELNSIISASFAETGVLIGQLIGDLATGSDAWSNFSNTAISAFGDLAISVGKMAIQTGTATLGIKAALESLNGWVAIAAGTALVALGTAVKSGLSNIASGSYSASSNIASSVGGGYSYKPGDYETRATEVKVSGTLKASGNTLLAVITNEEKRTNTTT